MRWPFRHRQTPSDRAGIAKAELAESIAEQIAEHADKSAAEHEAILRRNNLGPKIHRALGGY